MQTPDLQNVMRRVLEPVLQDRMLSFPWYQSWLRSAEQAEAAWERLPLVYSWNEVLDGNRLQCFTVSVNSGQVGQLLERHLPQAHPAFGPTRDLVTTVLANAQNGFLVGLCTELRMTPSQLSTHLKH